MKLNDKEYELLDKIAGKSKMDCWFQIRSTGKEEDYVYDLEEEKRMSLKKGIKQLMEGIDGMYDHYLSGDDYDTLLGLLTKLI